MSVKINRKLRQFFSAEEENKVLAVIGPTSSGKTKLAHKLSTLLDGEIVSADSVTIYKYLNIFSNKPTSFERSGVKYHLLDIITPDQQYNAGQFKRNAENSIRAIKTHKYCPVICGGTSLYIKLLFYGVIDSPLISDDIKQAVKAKFQKHGLKYCYDFLSKFDPQTAKRLDPNDTQRILRAMEIVETGAGSITDYQNKHRFSDKNLSPVYIMPDTPREVVYQNINNRTHEMVEKGGVEETELVLKMGYDQNCPGLSTIGYKQAVEYINGQLSIDDMIENIAKHTRHYAKRQFTWYKKYDNILRVSPDISESNLLERLETVLKS